MAFINGRKIMFAPRVTVNGGTDEKTAEILQRSITRLVDEKTTSIGEHALYSCNQLRTAIFPNVLNVGIGALQGCSALTTAEFPKATNINIYAFYGCGFETVNFPLVKSIAERAFSECQNLTTVNFPSAEYVGHYAFSNDTKLATVDFEKVTYIGDYVFTYCGALKTFIMRTPTVCTLFTRAAFTGTPIASGTGYIYVPDALVDNYKTATNWSVYASQIKPISELEG